MIKIPQNLQLKQINKSDILGNIWSSFNLDLTDNLGRIRVAPRGMIVTKSDDDGITHMTTPAVAFALEQVGGSGQQHMWAIAGTKMFRSSGAPHHPFTEDTTANSPVVNGRSSMELFNGYLYVIGSSKIMKWTGSWEEVGTNWGSTDTTCCVYAGRLYYKRLTSGIGSISQANARAIHSGTPNVVDYTLQLANFGVGGSSANDITCICASSNRIWIATADKTSQSYSAGRAGKVFEWDGASAQTIKVHYLDSLGAMAMIIKDDVPYIVDANGKLLAFNGSEFQEVARLPVPSSMYLRKPTNSIGQGFIHPKGICLRNGKILIFINGVLNKSGYPIQENIPSGIWEYDEDIGLYHKYSISMWQRGVTTTRTDFGQNRMQDMGALFSCKSTSDSASLNGDLLFSCKYFTTSSLTSFEKYAIFINDTRDTTSKVGYFVTTKIESQNIEDVWQKLYVIHKRLLDSSDRICLKYRTTEAEPIEVEITWLTTTSFTAVGVGNYVIGDEVEITSATGAGQIEHITNITGSGTYTVTLANAVIGATGTSRARFQKWISLGEITEQTKEWKEFPIGRTSNWVQFKCVMYFTGKDELNSLLLVNKTQLPAV